MYKSKQGRISPPVLKIVTHTSQAM